MKNTLRSSVLLFITAMIWGFAFVAQYLGAQHIGTFTFNGIRFLLGALSLIPVILIFERGKKDPEAIKYTLISGIIAGVILFFAASLQQLGVEITKDAGKAGFITGLYIVIVPFYGMFFRKKPALLTCIGAVFALAGLYFLCISGQSSIGIGDVILLIGAFFWAAHIVAIDRFTEKVYPLRFAATQFACCGAVSMLCSFIFESPTIQPIMSAALPLLYGGVISAGIAYTCQILGQRNLEPTYSAIIMSTESIFSAVGGMIILHQFMTPRGYLGCGLMFLGILFTQLKLDRIKLFFKGRNKA